MLQLYIARCHTKYHCDIICRFEDIRSQNYNELYMQIFSHCFDFTSGLTNTKLNSFFTASNYVTLTKFKRNRATIAGTIHMTLFVYFYIEKLPEVGRLYVHHMKTRLSFFYSNRMIGYKGNLIGNFVYY